MKYIFTAKDTSGELKKGSIDAIDRNSAVQTLQQNKLTVLSLDREGVGFSLQHEIQKALDRVTLKELVIFFRQLSTLIDAGVSVPIALHTLSDQVEGQYFRTVLKEVASNVDDGLAFSEALQKFPLVFSSLVGNMIHAGEVSGTLQQSVLFVANNTEKNLVLSSRIKGAMIYPAFVLSAAAIVGFIVVTVILPKLTAMIDELNTEISWTTRMVIDFGNFMQSYWWAVLIAIFGIIGGIFFYARSENGRREWDQIQLKLPVFGKLFSAVYIARFAENFSALLASGIPMVRALNIVADVVGNTVYRTLILRAAEEVKVGKTISSVFLNSPDIPVIVARMLLIGEETGKIDHILESTARFYDQEVDIITKNMMSLIEPILIVLLGIGVGVLVVAIIIPMYSVVGSM